MSTIVKKWDPVVGYVYFTETGETVHEVAVKGNATVADGKVEVQTKAAILHRNTLTDDPAIWTMQERQTEAQLAEVYAPPSEQPLSIAAANARWNTDAIRSFQIRKYNPRTNQLEWVIDPDKRELYEAWRATQLPDFVGSRKRDNGVNCFDIAVDGNEALVFKQENGSGKLLRFWINKSANVSARIRYVNTPQNPASWKLEVYLNQRSDEGWKGTKVAEHFVYRTVTTESELTVAKWVALYFARFAPKPVTQEDKDAKLIASATKSVSTYFPTH